MWLFFHAEWCYMAPEFWYLRRSLFHGPLSLKNTRIQMRLCGSHFLRLSTKQSGGNRNKWNSGLTAFLHLLSHQTKQGHNNYKWIGVVVTVIKHGSCTNRICLFFAGMSIWHKAKHFRLCCNSVRAMTLSVSKQALKPLSKLLHSALHHG